MSRSALCAAISVLVFFVVGVASADDPFHASLYLGEAVDTFAGAETIRYFNPDDSGSSTWRAIGGFDFEYRLGTPGSTRIWIYGETVHGVRSKDVDCSKDESKDLSICKDVLNASDPEKSLIYILRKATSLEAFAGLRWEIFRLNPDSSQPAWIYLKAQAGFISVDGGGSDVADVHRVAVGAQAERGGTFGGSYVEVGYGRNDLFLERSTGRWVIDGLLSFPLAGSGSSSFFGINEVRGFAQITADTDMGSGADSIQSYFGLDFILGKGAKKATPADGGAQ